MLACLLLQSDERVQLQRLRDQLLSSDGQPGRVQSQVLRAPLLLSLTDAESQLLEAYADRVAAWGWRWQPSSACSDCGSPETLLTHAPLLWGIALTTTDLTVGPARLNIACYSACAARIMSFRAKPFDRVCRACIPPRSCTCTSCTTRLDREPCLLLWLGCSTPRHAAAQSCLATGCSTHRCVRVPCTASLLTGGCRCHPVASLQGLHYPTCLLAVSKAVG